jgi:hypothetical protein
VPKKVSIIRELMRTTKVSRRRKTESEHDHLKRIAHALSELAGNVRANLSPEAQAWYQAAVENISASQAKQSLTIRHDISESSEGPGENRESEGGAEQIEEKQALPTSGIRREVGNVPRTLSASDRTRRIILENLGRVEKKTLRELVAKAGIKVANSSFDTIYYETNKTMQIARELGFVK